MPILLSVILGVAASLLLAGDAERSLTSAASQSATRTLARTSRSDSTELARTFEGEMCEWEASAATVSAMAQGRVGALARSSSGSSPSVDADRAPVRVIRDTYPSYSAVAVDNNSGEVYLQDENLFGIKVFDRLDNTPSNANFTEPKRIIGGPKTRMEYNCGLYVDPKNGDIYSLSSDTLDSLVVFPREAKGNVAPMRHLATPQGTYGLAVDEENEEMFMTDQETTSVVVYRKMASGKEPPLRELIGDKTQLADPHGVAVDPKNHLLIVSNSGARFSRDSGGKAIPGSGRFSAPSITMYPLNARGDTAPLRMIQGPQTQLNWPTGVYFDPRRSEIYVANDGGDSVLVFRETDHGDTPPARAIKGPRTGLKNPTGIFVDTKNDELWVTNMGSHTATVYALSASGDAAPLRTIRSAPPGQLALMFQNPHAVAYDSKREQYLVPN